MKILIVGSNTSALELLTWFQELAAGKPAQDLLEWSEGVSELELEITHTDQAEEAIRLARTDQYVIFISLIGISIPGETRKGINWGRFKRFEWAEKDGAWVLTQIKPDRRCKRKVAVITVDPGRIRQLCSSLDLAGVVPSSLGPRTKKAILEYLVRVAQNES